jgi:hypothetical protein
VENTLDSKVSLEVAEILGLDCAVAVIGTSFGAEVESTLNSKPPLEEAELLGLF